MLKKIKKCSYFGREREIKREKVSKIWENLYKLLKKEPFSSIMQIPKEKRWKSWRKDETNIEVFSVKTKM